MKNIVLIGMRGSGKSKIGKKLAKITKREFLDTDQLIEKEEHRTIPEIVKDNGWDYFRKVESEVIAEISEKEDIVISTGGGAILNKENIKNLQRNGIIVYLKADPVTLAQRIKNSTNRPALKEGLNLIDEMMELLKERNPIYESTADATADVSTQSEDKEKDIKLKAQAILELVQTCE